MVPQDVTAAMQELWDCSDEAGFSEDACSDLDERIKRGGPMDRMGLWRSAHGYMESELAQAEPEWRTVRALHQLWRAALAWSRGGA